MFTKEFLQDLLERVIATIAEVLLGFFGTASMLEDVDPKVIASVCAVAVIAVICKAIVKRYIEIHGDEK